MDREAALELLVAHAQAVNKDLEKIVVVLKHLEKRVIDLEQSAVKAVKVESD